MASTYKVLGQEVTAESIDTVSSFAVSSGVVTATHSSSSNNFVAGQPVTVYKPEDSLSISNKEIASNVATLTTSTNHRIQTGQSVTVSGVGFLFNGTFTVTAVTANTFSYDKVASDYSSEPATGTVEYFDLAFNGTFIVESSEPGEFTYNVTADDISVFAPTSATVTGHPWIAVYTCPSDTSTVLSNISICNQTELTSNYQIAISDTLDLSNKHLLFYNDSIQSFDTIQITGGFTLDATNKYLLFAADVQNVSISVFGAEVT